MGKKFGDDIWLRIKPFVRLEMLFVLIIGLYIVSEFNKALSTDKDFSAVIISVEYQPGVSGPKSGRSPAYYLVSVKLENGEIGRLEEVDNPYNLDTGKQITVTKRISLFGKISYYLKNR